MNFQTPHEKFCFETATHFTAVRELVCHASTCDCAQCSFRLVRFTLRR